MESGELDALIPRDSTSVSPARRWVMLILATFFSVTLSGIIFGWPAVVVMLEKEHVYGYLCESPVQQSCKAQTDQFNLIFTIASTGFACAVLPLGIILVS